MNQDSLKWLIPGLRQDKNQRAFCAQKLMDTRQKKHHEPACRSSHKVNLKNLIIEKKYKVIKDCKTYIKQTNKQKTMISSDTKKGEGVNHSSSHIYSSNIHLRCTHSTV